MTVNAERLRDLPGNDRCADCQDCDCPECGFPEPVWACEELGILVCDECMDLLHGLLKVSFKSIMCQDWTEESYQKMAATSNQASKELYEKHLSPAYMKPTRCFNLAFRRQWIISKYLHKEFMLAENQPSYMEGRKTGYLWKLGRASPIFQRRWFVLDPSKKGTLRYYTESNENSLRGEISLFKMNMVLASKEKIGHDNGLQLVYPDHKGQNTRMIYLYAELAKDMVEWFQAIRCLKYSIQRKKTVGKDEVLIRRILQYDILKEGYLLKTGAKGKEAFRKRWFVLDKLCLMYFKDPLDANPKGTIPMRAGYSLILSGQLDPENRGYHFLLKTTGRIYHFIAETDHDRKAWFTAIHAACNRASGVSTSLSTPAPGKISKASSLPELDKIGKPKTESESESSISKTDMTVSRKAAAGDSSKVVSQASAEEPEPLSRPFEGVRASTKPRPQHTLMGYHGKGHTGQGRYQPAEPKTHPAIEIEEEDPYIEFTEMGASSEESSEEEEESPYVELEGEKVVMMQTVDVVGMTTKQLSTHLKVPRKALPQSSSCNMCISLMLDTQPILPESEGCVSVSPIISCCSMPRNVELLQPFQLEIQHSAILKDVMSCQPQIWHLNKEPGKFSKWEKAQQGSLSLTCKASHRNFVIETGHSGCFAIMVPSEALAGKMLRCMTYISSEQQDNHLVVRVYFFDDNGSDDILHEIQRREKSYNGHLCDISGSFLLANNASDNILMTMDELEGMEMFFGGEPMTISTEELLVKQMLCYTVEILKTSPVGQCTINVWQENTALEKEPVKMNLHFSNKMTCPVIAPVPYLSTSMPMPAAIPVRYHKPISRVSSEPPASKPSQLLAHRTRDDRHARSVPNRSRLAEASAAAPLLHPKASPLLQPNMLPFSVKRDLFLLLDKKVAAGNDWRMLASQLGLDAMIYCFDLQINPTMEVLKAFEIMNRPLSELEDYLRHMGRNDAADVIKAHTEKIPKTEK